jgi:hypothetical protein
VNRKEVSKEYKGILEKTKKEKAMTEKYADQYIR